MSTFRRQLMMGAANYTPPPPPPLPYDAEVEYLESTGVQYIDTGILGANNLITTLDVRVMSVSASKAIFGAYEADNNYYIYLSNTSLWQVGFGTLGNANAADSNRHVFVLGNGEVKLDGTTILTGSSGTFETPKSLLLFNMHQANGATYTGTNTRLYRATFVRNGVKIMDLIPVRVGSVGYMYDKVSNQLFGNDGSGNFIVGADKGTYDAEVEWIGGTGTQYIDTGINLASNTTEVRNVMEMSITDFTYNGNALMIAISQPNSGVQVYTTYASSANRILNQNASLTPSANTFMTVTTVTTATIRTIQVNSGTVASQNFNRSISDGSRLYILGFPDWVSSGQCSHCKYKTFKIYINNNLVCYYTPVRVGQVGYLYDNVSRQLVGNAGTGDFTLGNDITT